MSKGEVLGRIWLFDDQPTKIETWEHKLEPMDCVGLSCAEWVLCHLQDLPNDELREMLKIPESGNFQVIFSGIMYGESYHSLDGDEWDEWFERGNSTSAPVPDEFMKMIFPEPPPEPSNI